MNWTHEQCEELFKLWNFGERSFSELATHFGTTRSSVASRMRREKRDRNIPVEDRYSHPSKFPKSKKVNNLIPVVRRKRMDVPSIPVPDASCAVSIVDVTGCKWAVGYDENAPGGHLFCNHGTDEGSAYCPYHAIENVADYSRTLISKTVRSAWHAYKAKAA